VSYSVISYLPTLYSRQPLRLLVRDKDAQRTQRADPTSFCKTNLSRRFIWASYWNLLNLALQDPTFAYGGQELLAVSLRLSKGAEEHLMGKFLFQDPRREFFG
jgi:hypothetical protein